MIALYLLAAHLVGDFVLQSRHMAILKFTSRRMRTYHVAWYMVPFLPIAFVYATPAWAVAFLVAVAVLHWLTDSRRFHSNVGDLIQWRLDMYVDPVACKRVWLEYVTERYAEDTSVTAIDVDDKAVRWPPPNPWPQLPFALDQTLHILQLAVLGGLLLR